MVVAFEFTAGLGDKAAPGIVEWESGDNRKADVIRLEDGEQLVIYGGNIRTKCKLVYHDELLGIDDITNHEIRELYI